MKTKLNKISVKNMTSSNGNLVPNQFIISMENAVYFQSYNSIIAVKILVNGVWKTLLDSYYWDYSRTTTKYRIDFLGEHTAETKEKIKSGEYKLVNLN